MQSLSKQRKQFLQANDKQCEAVDLPTKQSDLPLNTGIIMQTHRVMMENEKDFLAREYRTSPMFAGCRMFPLAGYIERYKEDAVFRFHEAQKDDPIMTATNLFGNIINIHPFEDENRKKLSLNFSSCFDTGEILPISSHFKLFSYMW